MIKICALDQIIKILGLTNGKNPYTSGEKTYEKELIFSLVNGIYSNIPLYGKVAASRLLDWYFPEWRDFVDSGITGQLLKRRDNSVRKWVKVVLLRDNNTCVICGSLDNPQAHHILHWATSPELRVDVDNGITLCGECHHEARGNMGKAMFVKGVKND